MGISGCRDERQKRAIARAGLPLLSEGKGQKMAAPEPAPAPVVADNAPPKRVSSARLSVPANRFTPATAILS